MSVIEYRVAAPPHDARELLLLGTRGCHLCEDAAEELRRALEGVDAWHWHAVDVADDAELLRRYGHAIPVLLGPSTRDELRWPFDAADIARFLRSPGLPGASPLQPNRRNEP